MAGERFLDVKTLNSQMIYVYYIDNRINCKITQNIILEINNSSKIHIWVKNQIKINKTNYTSPYKFFLTNYIWRIYIYVGSKYLTVLLFSFISKFYALHTLYYYTDTTVLF